VNAVIDNLLTQRLSRGATRARVTRQIAVGPGEGGDVSVKATAGEMQEPSAHPVSQRQHGSKRTRATLVRLSDEEHALLSSAAQRAGLSLAGYLAVAAQAAARGTGAPGSATVVALHELMQARSMLGQVNANLQRLASGLATGTEVRSRQLDAVVDAVRRITSRVDEAAASVHRRVR
jgi:hypothetical protein